MSLVKNAVFNLLWQASVASNVSNLCDRRDLKHFILLKSYLFTKL